MAHSLSAKKRIRTTKRRTEINRDRMSRIRTFVKKAESAITGNQKEEAQSAVKIAMAELHRGVSKGVLHKNTAARKISRLTKRAGAIA